MKLRRSVSVALLAVMLAATVAVTTVVKPNGAVLGTATGSGGVVLDGYGGVHVFGDAAVNTTGAPYWAGWDIARAVSVLPGGSGGYTLDGWGGVHAWGAAPALAATTMWKGWDIARGLWVSADGSMGYVLDGFGGVHALGNAPPLTGPSYWGWDIARGIDIHLNSAGIPDGGWVIDGYGGVHAFGAAPALASVNYAAGYDVYSKIHVVSGGAYVVARYGIVANDGSPAGISWTGYPSWGTWDIVRDVVPLNAELAPSAQPVNRVEAAGMMDRFQSIDRVARRKSAIGTDAALSAIAGNGDTYNEARCGGPPSTIADRSADMYRRNYFDHAIAGCAGTQYVFSTYLTEYRVSYRQAGENIAWRVGDSSVMTDVIATNSMWLNSPPHLSNIVGPYNSTGCGVYYTPSGSYQGASGQTWVWVCEFRG